MTNDVIRQLESEVAHWKQQLKESNLEKRRLEKENDDLKERDEHLQSQVTAEKMNSQILRDALTSRMKTIEILEAANLQNFKHHKKTVKHLRKARRDKKSLNEQLLEVTRAADRMTDREIVLQKKLEYTEEIYVQKDEDFKTVERQNEDMRHEIKTLKDAVVEFALLMLKRSVK